MKKIIIFLSIFLSGFYLINFISAISVTKNAGEILDNSTWGKIASITDKMSVDSGNLNINGKVYVSGDICDNAGNCLSNINKKGSINKPGTSCKDILDSGVKEDGTYYIKPDGYSGSAFQVYCDMTTSGGGWTKVKDDTTMDYNTTLATYTRVSFPQSDAFVASGNMRYDSHTCRGGGPTIDGVGLTVGVHVDRGDPKGTTYSMNFDLKIKFKEVRFEGMNSGSNTLKTGVLKFGDFFKKEFDSIYEFCSDGTDIFVSNIDTNSIYLSNDYTATGGGGIRLKQLRVR